MPDHIHVAVSIPPSILISTVVGRLKGASAHAVNHNGQWTVSSPFAWQGEYGIHSFGENALPTVVAYVQNQETHHAADTLWPGLERTTDENLSPSSQGRSCPRRGM
ncbi:MAG: IS200/IS605 family transposase [Thermomicrobiales bacterium]